ncbi:hypothetical protein ACFV4E_15200 [Streptomyces hygroscopicus]|uniref:hypothetical protein n=1 Tax=Streptomyces hygroscopicus TaxID=1912 RepID=UPI0036C1B4F0
MGNPIFLGPDGIEVAHGHLRPAPHVDMGNPHAVAFVDDLSEVADLRDAPKVTPSWAYPDGVTVELVTARAPHHLALRVHERGVGETPACGTGACAAAAAWRRHQQHAGPGRYIVDVPGGRLLVTAHADRGMQLTGPTAIVADGFIPLGVIS